MKYNKNQTNENITFYNENHEQQYLVILERMQNNDCYHRSAAYLMALAQLVPDDVFNFEEDCIKPEGLNCHWQTTSSLRATCLMFNLWNGYVYEDKNAKANAIASPLYAVHNIFCDYEYAPYFYEAICIRFEWN